MLSLFPEMVETSLCRNSVCYDVINQDFKACMSSVKGIPSGSFWSFVTNSC